MADTEKPTVQGKTQIYNQIIEKPIVSGRDAQKAYAGKFQVIDIRQGGEFAAGHIKGHEPRFFWASWDPRPVRQETIPARVVLVWVVSPEGRVIEPRVIQSPDKRLAEQVIAEVTHLRYAPARLRGIAVFSLWSHQFVFGGDKRQGDSGFKDGLGIRIRQ
jgi:rhodanese-related sulfurtransferase